MGTLQPMRVVILCGGSGSRLWPESRESFPKQFIPLFDGKSLLEKTIERFINIMQVNKPIFICNKKHGFLLKKIIEKYNIESDIFLEPEGRNTSAAIYLAAKHCRDDENLLIMPSDHLIPDTEKFLKHLSVISKNLKSDYWVTLGIKPTKPSEAYGYIKVRNNQNSKLLSVMKFIEKPNKKLATTFMKDDQYFWNAGIFIANATKIKNSIKQHAPNIAIHCDKNYDSISTNKEKNEFNFSAKLFSQIPSVSIDYSVMEHEKKIYLLPFNGNWSDVGSWDSLSEIYEDEPTDNNIIQIDSQNNFVRTKKRTIATIGVKDLIVIDSDNATLISKKGHAEKVKDVVNQLLEKDLVIGKEHSFEYRPWGKFENLLEDEFCKVKRLIISPKKRLSLQYHNFRSEHWLIVDGIANIYLNGKDLVLNKGKSVDVPKKHHHYIENKETKDLIIIETQLGSYFGEDDIIRLHDPYSR